jgi:hypothetical protein
MSCAYIERSIPYAVVVDRNGNVAAHSVSGHGIKPILTKAYELAKNVAKNTDVQVEGQGG